MMMILALLNVDDEWWLYKSVVIMLGNDSNPLVNLYSRANLPTCYALKCEDGYFAHYLVSINE